MTSIRFEPLRTFSEVDAARRGRLGRARADTLYTPSGLTDTRASLGEVSTSAARLASQSEDLAVGEADPNHDVTASDQVSSGTEQLPAEPEA